MANIYNDTSEPIRESVDTTNGNFTNLTVQNLIAQNIAVDNINSDTTAVFSSLALPNLSQNDLLLVGVSGAVNGLTPGNNNDVLKTLSGVPTWSNDLILNNLQTNTLKIPGTTGGDILTFTNTSEAQRLPIGSSGTFLISDGIQPSWQSLPNPLILGGLQVNGNFELTGFGNATLITDTAGFIVSERLQLANSPNSYVINTTPSVIYLNASWSFTQNAYYKISLYIDFTTSEEIQGDFTVNFIKKLSIYTAKKDITNTYEIIYLHSGATTNSETIGITNLKTLAGSATVNSFYITAERIPTPLIHV